MEMDILSVLEHKFPSFSKGQRTIAQFILKNYDKAAFIFCLGNVLAVIISHAFGCILKTVVA